MVVRAEGANALPQRRALSARAQPDGWRSAEAWLEGSSTKATEYYARIAKEPASCHVDGRVRAVFHRGRHVIEDYRV
jgi:hypothetical protein